MQHVKRYRNKRIDNGFYYYCIPENRIVKNDVAWDDEIEGSVRYEENDSTVDSCGIPLGFHHPLGSDETCREDCTRRIRMTYNITSVLSILDEV